MMKENDDASWTDRFPITDEGQRHALKSNEEVPFGEGIKIPACLLFSTYI